MTAVTTAVILAAGRGTRLAGEVSDRPKGLLRIGERPIIEESIASLADAGIQDVILVTGHLAPLYEQFVRRFPAVRTVHNERFADSGSLYSLYQARSLLRGPFLLLESDLVYEPRALATLLEGPDEDAILVSGPTAAGDEVYVSTEAGRLAGMSKRREALAGTIAGELVGITRVSAALFEIMCRYAGREFATDADAGLRNRCAGGGRKGAGHRLSGGAGSRLGRNRRCVASGAGARAGLAGDRAAPPGGGCSGQGIDGIQRRPCSAKPHVNAGPWPWSCC